MDRLEQDIKAGRITESMNFNQRVWAMTARIPCGQVTTYGQMARLLGSPKAARAVGQALHRNPYAPTVPCHRVVGSTGQLTGFASGVDKKRQMLQEEGVTFRGQRVDVTRLWQGD